MRKLFIIASIIFLMASAHSATDFEFKKETSFNPEFNNRFSLSAGLNHTVYRSQDVKSVQGSYARKMFENDLGTSWWLDFFLQQTTGKFSDLAQNNPTAIKAPVTDDVQDLTQNIKTLGVGVQYKTEYAKTLMPFDLYELSGASAMYGLLKEDYSGETFSGPGVKAKFSLMKPLNDYCHIGFNFDYNILSLKRNKGEAENLTSSGRSLTFSWLTIGLDFSLFL